MVVEWCLYMVPGDVEIIWHSTCDCYT